MKVFASLLAISAMPAQASQEHCLRACQSSYDWCVAQGEDSIEVCSDRLRACVNRCSNIEESELPAVQRFSTFCINPSEYSVDLLYNCLN
jgi:hypothetical protein